METKRLLKQFLRYLELVSYKKKFKKNLKLKNWKKKRNEPLNILKCTSSYIMLDI